MAIYCSLAFGSASIDHTGYKPCCNFQGKFNPDTGLNANHLNDIHLIKVREALAQNKWPKGCKNCKEAEENGYASMRTIWNTELGNDIPLDTSIDPINVKYLDLTFSNKCNSKCMTCGPAASHLWEDEWDYIFKETAEDLPKNAKNALNRSLWNKTGIKIHIENDKVHNLITTYPNVEHVSFVGGEPTIHEEGILFLKELVRLDRAKNIHINYVTNLTGLTQELLDIWQEFKAVHLSVSIDGYGKINEYIRYPFKWKKIEENVIQMFENTIKYPGKYTISLSHTVSLLSIMYSHELLEWWWELSKKYKDAGELYNIYSVFLNRVWSPDYFKTDLLSKEFRCSSLSKLEKLQEKILSDLDEKDKDYHGIDTMWKDQIGVLKTWLQEKQETYPQVINNCLHFIDNSDKFRKRTIKDFMPELYEELQRMKTKIDLTSAGPGYEIIFGLDYTKTELTAKVKEHLCTLEHYSQKIIKINETTEWKTQIGFPHTIPQYNNLLASDYKQDIMGVSIMVPMGHGATFNVVPGSHEKDWPHADLKSETDIPLIDEFVEFQVPIGSAVMFNPRLLHSFAPRKFTQNYDILLINYVRSDIIDNLNSIKV